MSKDDDKQKVVASSDMPEKMQKRIMELAKAALSKYSIEKDIASFIKRSLDEEFKPIWHCVVGKQFGSYVTHEEKGFMYFFMGNVAILVWK